MKSRAQLEESIKRFRESFWNRRAAGRPPVGIAADRAWQPIGYLKRPLPEGDLRPECVTRDLFRTDYEDAFARRAVMTDDWIPFSAAWRAVPWLEAMCGCAVRGASGSLAPERVLGSAAEWAEAPVPANTEWMARLEALTAELVATAPEDCWVAPSIFRGVSDVLGAMRGLSDFFLDLVDDPDAVTAAGARVNRLHLDVLARHFALVPPKLGGYGHIFGYWAPGPTTVIQEDALGMCSPAIYERRFRELGAEVARRFGPYVLFHLHSTGYRHWRHVLDIPEIAGLELTVESNGPPLADMVPDLRAILERSRLILVVDAWFGQLREAVRRLPTDGLYLVVSDRFVAGEREFRELLTAW